MSEEGEDSGEDGGGISQPSFLPAATPGWKGTALTANMGIEMTLTAPSQTWCGCDGLAVRT